MARSLVGLTIGPSDPAGIAGVLADVKAFSSLGLHGAAAITSAGMLPLSADGIAAQVDAVLGAGGVDVVKLEPPPDSAVLEALAEAVGRHDVEYLVLDPGAGSDGPTVQALRGRLLPLAYIVTPNLAEAEALAGRSISTWDDMRDAATAIAAMGAKNVVIKGGKRDGDVVTDLLFDGADYREYSAERVDAAGIGGVGTTFAAGLAASLAKGDTVHHSVAAAKAYVTKALQSAYEAGDRRALHHFYRYWRPSGR